MSLRRGEGRQGGQKHTAGYRADRVRPSRFDMHTAASPSLVLPERRKKPQEARHHSCTLKHHKTTTQVFQNTHK